MTTRFTLTLVHHDPAYARQAASDAFAELDLIEQKLSRFLEGSDIFRINRLQSGQTTLVSIETLECLHIALAVQRETAGAFDVTFRSSASANPGAPRFEILPGQPAVRSLVDRPQVDLGAIGKGYALDRLALLLADWEIHSALLCADTSTVLALQAPPGEPGWRVILGPEHAPRSLALANRASSASGKAVKGEHIIDPATDQPVRSVIRAWSTAQSAAEADALSTAFMVMSEQQIRHLCQRHNGISAYLLKEETGPLLEFQGD